MNTINRFRGEHRWLSNFAPAAIAYGNHTYPTVEHAYQAAKTNNDNERRQVLACVTPGQAKRWGRQLTIRADWEIAKRDVMLGLLRLKFQQEPYRQQLIGTGDAVLVEGNEWGDTYWGICGGKGQNVLGQLLMQVRSEITFLR
jgi:N-glycosidase YbiA